VTTAQVEALGVKATGRDGSSLQHLMRLDVGRLRVEEGMPVLDEQARVVAITIHDDDGKVFGIPVEILRAAVRTTAAHGHVVVPWLGVTGVDAADFDQAGFDGGAAIQKVVTGSPAAQAGLQPGDVVVAVDDQALDTMSALALALRDHDAGDAIALTYVRDGNVGGVTLTLADEATATPQPTG
jgi:putative serine protease PepD